jgi:TolB protein
MAFGVAAPADAAFPGRNGHIAWTSIPNGTTEIFAMRPDGSRQRNLTNNTDADFIPAYSPDGKRIAFAHHPLGPQYPNPVVNAELYIMNADGSRIRQLTHNRLIDWDAAWSPDGRRLVFERGPAPASPDDPLPPTDLWILDLKTGEERNLTNSPATYESEAQWSPDGSRIAFDSDLWQSGNTDVYTIRPNGQDLRRLTDDPAFDGGPNYSPDGRLIAFDSERTGNSDVFVMRTDGTRPTQLTDDPGTDLLSCFSPDGRSIAFTSERHGAPIPDQPGSRYPDIFRMRADGSHQTNLTRSPAIGDYNPDWQPR